MDRIKKMIAETGLEKQITVEDVPEIDLYVDQVIQLFENKFNTSKRHNMDKVLTKTMINNYAKGKLFIPIKNKKYSREHLLLISLIYQLKGGLSLNDIKATLSGVNEKILEGNLDLESFYNSYLSLFDKNIVQFAQEAESRMLDADREAETFNDESQEYLNKVLYIASFIMMSNFYRRTAEKLVDEIMEAMAVKEKEIEKEKAKEKDKKK